MNLSEQSMKPSEFCKSKGLRSLRELSEISGISERVLYNLFNRDYRHFELLVEGAVKVQSGSPEIININGVDYKKVER